MKSAEKRLIDANAASARAFHSPNLTRQEAEIIIDFLDQQETVDAVEVVHGRWLFVTKGQQTSVFVCSECNVAITLSCDEDLIEEKLKKDHPYCRCGARMDGDRDA